MQRTQQSIRICAILLMTAMLFSLVGAAVSNSACSAEEEWIVGSGWTDYSSNGNISFQNTSDSSGYMRYKELFDGQEGLKLSYQVDFPEPTFSVARFVLWAGSQPGKFFNILVYSENGAISFDVGFCDNGTWTAPVVANTGKLDGVTDSLRVHIEREAGSDYIRFILTDTEDNVVCSRVATDAAYIGAKFLDAGDICAEVSAYAGGNIFRFSRFTHDTYPDDGIEDPVTAEQDWSMAEGWTDGSADGKVAVTGGPAGSYIRSKSTVSGASDFRISFVVEPKDKVDTSFVVTLGNPLLSAYLNIESTSNWVPEYQSHTSTQAIALNRGAEYSWAWNSLGGLGWNWTPGAFRLTFEYRSATHQLILTREGVDGDVNTPKTTATVRVPAPADEPGSCSDEDFFSFGGGVCRIDVTAKNGAQFTITDFVAENVHSASMDWTMPSGWTDSSDFEADRIVGTAGEINMRRETIDALTGLDMHYTLSATGSAKVTTVLAPKGKDTPTLKLIQTLQNGVLSLDADYCNGETVRLLSTPQSVCGNPITFYLSRVAGSDTLQVKVQLSTGSIAGTYNIKDPAFDAWALFDYAPLTVGMAVNEGKVTVSDFVAQSNPRAEAEQDLFKLSKGWTAYNDDDGGLYLLKSDGRENEAIYNPEIDGSKGFRITYNITYLADTMTTTYVKIGFFREECTQYFFSRIKGSSGKLYAEGQVYDQTEDDWSGNLLSGSAGEGREVGRTVKVLLERQQGSSYLHFAVSDNAGNVIFSDYLKNEIIQPSMLNAKDLRFILGRDSDAASFLITDVSVEEYPVVPVAMQTAEIDGMTEAYIGQKLRYAADVTPSEATLQTIVWTVDNEIAAEDSTVLTYTFRTLGRHVIHLTLTDFSGNTVEKELELLIKPQPAGLGDVNLDGVVDTNDAELILRYAVGKAELTAAQKKAADINLDGKIDSTDAQMIFAGWEAADNEK